MKLNINDTVRVKLNLHGRMIMYQNYKAMFGDKADLFARRVVEEDRDGWSKWQLWDLMHEFGSHIYSNCTMPFETEIEYVGGSF